MTATIPRPTIDDGYGARRFLVVLHKRGRGVRTAVIAADASDDLWREAERAFPGWEITRAEPVEGRLPASY